MVNNKLLEIVNHEVWLEPSDGRVLLKWGHYPETDGKLDPVCITRAFTDVFRPAVVGIDKDSSAKGGLFIEFEDAKALAVEYDRGIYSLTSDKKWIFGRTVPPNYCVEEARHILGSAKVHLDGRVRQLSLELEIVDKVLFRGKPVYADIKLRNSEGTFKLENLKDAEFAEGINVLSARYVDEAGYVKRSIVTTLTVVR